jgi:uncharacterized protein
MNIPVQLIILTLPSVIYIAVRKSCGEDWDHILAKLGWQGCLVAHYVWGLGILVLLMGLSWLAIRFVPADLFQYSYLSTSYYAGRRRSVTSFLLVWLREAIYVALGEEIFFRGLLGGYLMRRFGFVVGNTEQALIFLLPHLLLLMVSLHLWPLLVVQLTAGWFLGWLLYMSGSILPGWVIHSLANAFGAFLMMNRLRVGA